MGISSGSKKLPKEVSEWRLKHGLGRDTAEGFWQLDSGLGNMVFQLFWAALALLGQDRYVLNLIPKSNFHHISQSPPRKPAKVNSQSKMDLIIDLHLKEDLAQQQTVIQRGSEDRGPFRETWPSPAQVSLFGRKGILLSANASTFGYNTWLLQFFK